MTGSTPTPSGHRLEPHTADTIVEAWGPTASDCLVEAVLGLVSAFAEIPAGTPTRTTTVSVEAPSPADLLVAVLEEVVFLLDVEGVIPAGGVLGVHQLAGKWQADGALEVCGAAEVEAIGAVPKAVARSDLTFAPYADGWRARVTIDV